MNDKKESTLDRAIESAGCAGAHIEGDKEYKDPSKIVYHENGISSIPYEKYFPKYFGMGIKEKNCAWCGKVFCPTPEWAYGECCRYTCALRYDESVKEGLSNAKKVVMLHPETRKDIMVFKDAQEAAGFVEKSAKDIRLVCNKLRQTAGGYGWRWADEKPIELADVLPTYVEEPKKPMTIWVKESVYDLLKDIAKSKGTSANKVAAKILEKELHKEYEE